MQDRRSETEEDLADRRAHPRKRVLWMAELRGPGGVRAWGVVMNVSRGGAKIRLDADSPLPGWPAGTSLNMSIPERADLPAAVVWCEGNHLGLQFEVAPEEAGRQLATVLGE